eukprot:PhM_4_TR3029/c0_g2_i2/m.41389
MLAFIRHHVSYKTLRMLRIPDPRLVILNVTFFVAAFVYVIVVQILVQRRYRVFESTAHDLFITTGGNNVNDNATFGRAVRQLGPAGNVPYCKMRGDGLQGCLILDGDDVFALNPPIQGNVYVTTRVNEDFASKTPTCNDGFFFCDKRIQWVNKTKYFILGPEKLELWLDHAVWAPELYRESGQTSYFSTSHEMIGKLVDQNDNVLLEFVPPDDPTVPCRRPETYALYKDCTTDVSQADLDHVYYYEKARRHTVIPVETLLAAGGIASLDDRTDLPGAESWATYRYYGARLAVEITYTNDIHRWVASNHFQFTIRVMHVKQSEYHLRETTFAASDGTITYPQRHAKKVGLHISVSQGGNASKFHFGTFLETLTTWFVLIGVATVVVDMTARVLLGYETDIYVDVHKTEKNECGVCASSRDTTSDGNDNSTDYHRRGVMRPANPPDGCRHADNTDGFAFPEKQNSD